MAISFDKLVGALAGAVVEASNQVKQTHISDLWRYFKDGSPVSTELQIPRFDHSTGQQGEPVRVNVPLISLINPSQLAIKQMQVTMQLDLNDILDTTKQQLAKSPKATATPVSYEWKRSVYNPAVMASTASGKQAGQSGTAQVVLIVEAVDPPEALSKLLDHLNKSL